jgi:site-specific DNA recombinase
MMKRITKIDCAKTSSGIKPKLRVAAYCRVSTDSDEQLLSLEAQKSHYKAYIKANPEWEYAGLYYDEGVSGTNKEKRSELQKMIKDCENRKIDFIVTKSISRFARNTADCLELVRKLIDLGIYIYFEKENINTKSMENELMLSVLSGLAESESVSISENNKWGIQKRFQNGTFRVAYPPYGYDSIDGDMVINPKQAETVKFIFTETLTGKGAQKIADDLNRQGIFSKRGGRWTGGTIRGILNNEKYTGDCVFQKTYTDSQFNRHLNYGEKDKYMIKDHHEPIISHEEFDAVNAVINQRAKEKGIEKRNEKYQNRYTFSGKIVCSECGSTFKRRIHSTGTRKYVAWCCNKHLKQITECSMQFIRDEDIKTAFVTMMNKLIYGHKHILKPLISDLRNQNNDECFKEIEKLELRIEENSVQRQVLMSLRAKGYLESALFNKEKNVLDSADAELKRQKERYTYLVNAKYEEADVVNQLMKFAAKSQMLTMFEDELFKTYVERIVVFSREEIGFELKCGLTLRERLVN